MPDDRSIQGPADRSRVNVNEAHEVTYWNKEFGCTEAQLRAAVSAVGPMVDDIRQYFGRQNIGK